MKFLIFTYKSKVHSDKFTPVVNILITVLYLLLTTYLFDDNYNISCSKYLSFVYHSKCMSDHLNIHNLICLNSITRITKFVTVKWLNTIPCIVLTIQSCTCVLRGTICILSTCISFSGYQEPSWSLLYGSWICIYVCNQWLSPQKVGVRIQLMAMCIRYNIMR